MAKNKGSMIIPEGRELWEWRGLNQVVDGLLEPNVTRNQANRIVGYGRPAKPILHHDQPESHKFKDAVIIGINDTKLRQ